MPGFPLVNGFFWFPTMFQGEWTKALYGGKVVGGGEHEKRWRRLLNLRKLLTKYGKGLSRGMRSANSDSLGRKGWEERCNIFPTNLSESY